MPHIPVLLHEVIESLDLHPGDFVVDGTIGGGGHAVKILERTAPDGKLLGVDWDQSRIDFLNTNLGFRGFGDRVILAHGNYADIPAILAAHRLPKAHGLLLDLGFSSDQLEGARRGFSFMEDEPLLMTYDDAREPAKEVLESMDERTLTGIIRDFSGERFAKRIARAIVAREREKPITTSGELSEVVRSAVPPNYEMRRIHPATRTFQAIRMYVNDELGNLERVLKALPAILATGGHAAIISFHSLEDGAVKRAFKQFAKEKQMTLTTKKPITASEAEIAANPRSRSAKLRVGILE